MSTWVRYSAVAKTEHGCWPMCRDCKNAALRRGRVSAALKLEIFARDGHRCQHCGTAEDLTIDHIIPTSLGGDSAPENLQALCRACNSRKGDRPNSDYEETV